MKLKDAITPGLDWRLAYPVIEEAVKTILKERDGSGITAKALIIRLGLNRQPKAHRDRFVHALKALRKHGLADWYSAVQVPSHYDKEKLVSQFLYQRPSHELVTLNLETRRDELTRELNSVEADLAEIRAAQ